MLTPMLDITIDYRTDRKHYFLWKQVFEESSWYNKRRSFQKRVHQKHHEKEQCLLWYMYTDKEKKWFGKLVRMDWKIDRKEGTKEKVDWKSSRRPITSQHHWLSGNTTVICGELQSSVNTGLLQGTISVEQKKIMKTHHQCLDRLGTSPHHERHPRYQLPVEHWHRQASSIQICPRRVISINSRLQSLLQFLHLLLSKFLFVPQPF